MNSDKLQLYIELTKKKRKLEAELDSIKESISTLQEDLLDQFGDEGINSIKSNGATVYIKRELWASPNHDYASACEALRQAGLEHFVQERFNHNTVSAYFRDLDREGEAIPESLKEAFKLNEKFSLQIRIKGQNDNE